MRNKKIGIYLVLPFLLALSILASTITFSTAVEPPKSANSNIHPIFISGDKQLDAFVAGNGTEGTYENPHIIENFIIHTGTDEYGIFIQSVDKHLILRNCVIYATDTAFSEKNGIEIRISTNVIIENCSVSYHEIGIMLLASFFVTIRNSSTMYNQLGIELLESDNNTLNNNTISNNLGYGIFLKRSHRNYVVNNTIEGNTDLGILDKGNDNIFENNSCEPETSRPVNRTWLWIVLGVGGAAFFVIGTMFFFTMRGRV